MGKSSCCTAAIWRVGERRRRCSSCRRSWRIRAKKRGRPRLRTNDRLIDRVFRQRRTLTELARPAGVSRQALSYRFLRALERRLLKPRPGSHAQEANLALLTDGLWFRFKRRPWVLYLMALKSPEAHTAVFIDPVMQSGSESRQGWLKAIETIPAEKRARIRALVCDNFAGCTTIAKRQGWILQLCHFHLVASLRRRLGHMRPRGVSQRALRQQGYALVRRTLAETDEAAVEAARAELRRLADDRWMPWRYGNILREFAKRMPAYRAYQLHPELRLPRTTGTVESMGRVIRDLMRQSRSLRTPGSVRLWVTNYLRLRPEIICRPGQNYTD